MNFDINNDGKLTMEEFDQALKSINILNVDKKTLEHVFVIIDKNKDGLLSIEEFFNNE